MNDIVHKPVSTRLLNPNMSKASYKPKQHGYRMLCTKMVWYSNVNKQEGSTLTILGESAANEGETMPIYLI